MNPFVEKISYITHAYELCSGLPCRTYKLTQTELDVVAFLANNPGKDTASDVSTYRYISKAAVSIAVDSLITRGFLRRSTDHDDRRRIHLVLTQKGRALVPGIQLSREELCRILFKDFTKKETDEFAALFEHMAENAHSFISTDIKGDAAQ